ncbi:Mut7-C RNAse domain-containing protein [Rapidithrix thailandica]|uniref:Mut7-C RNAse domain-containing protein n=1 Tax=Rapidithrix thailandica TaxID=413964 RepID=A0AAW9S411_9BACT
MSIEEAKHSATFSFSGNLNDFLPEESKNVNIPYHFKKHPAVKHAIEAMGVPHIEVDGILVNQCPVKFDYPLQDKDRVQVFPIGSFSTIPQEGHLQAPLKAHEVKFILDVHLSKLNVFLRLAGIDSYYNKDYDDPEIVQLAEIHGRIALTRDKGLLRRKILSRGYWIRSTDPKEQFWEVMHRYNLWSSVQLVHRCVQCNTTLVPIAKERILSLIPAFIYKMYRQFYYCPACQKAYWDGPHFQLVKQLIEEFKEQQSLT